MKKHYQTLGLKEGASGVSVASKKASNPIARN